MIKRIFLIVLLGFVLYIFIDSIANLPDIYNPAGKDFFAANGLDDTGSRNLVVAIYLDYRLFDTILEASILLLAVSGVMWFSHYYSTKKKPKYMIDSQKTPELFITLSRMFYPIMTLFGIYIIVNGHLSPGGGFQGGVIVATAILILYYIDISKFVDIDRILTIDKFLFVLLIALASFSILTRNEIFTSFIPISQSVEIKSIYLISMNVLIGIKVALSMIVIFTNFLREGVR